MDIPTFRLHRDSRPRVTIPGTYRDNPTVVAPRFALVPAANLVPTAWAEGSWSPWIGNVAHAYSPNVGTDPAFDHGDVVGDYVVLAEVSYGPSTPVEVVAYIEVF